jgi:hypothetical protein
MKKIEPISIWDNGTNQNATILNAYCINDNLSTSAAFYYALLSNDKAQLAQGNLTMSGEIYDAWETNDYAYNWIAEQLNLTIIGDYVPPVPEPIIITSDGNVGMATINPTAELEITPEPAVQEDLTTEEPIAE